MTDARDVERRLRASEERLRGLLETIEDFIWETDETGAFTYASPQVESLVGYPPSEFIGKTHYEFMAPAERRRVAATLRPLIKAHQAFSQLENTLLHKNGQEVVFESSGVPIFDINGMFKGYRGVDRDITERRAAIAALAYRDRILHSLTVGTAELAAGESMEIGMANALRAIGETLNVDRVMVIERMSGTQAAPELRYSWQRRGLPVRIEHTSFGSGGQEVRAAVDAWLAPLSAGKPVMSRVGTLEGPVRRILDSLGNKSTMLMPILVNGQPWGAIGMDDCKSERDWTPSEIDALEIFAEIIGAHILQNSTLQALQKSEERLRAVSETAQDAIVMIDPAGEVRYWNNAAERIFGYTAADAMGKDVHEWLAPPRFREKARAALRAFAASGHGDAVGKTLELAAMRKDGVEIPIELSLSAMRLGSEWHAVAVLRDITERKHAEDQIRSMARSDGLTGLANRAVFVEGLQHAIMLARRSGRPFAVLYLDLDHFKDVNDTLGHPTGDLLLQSVAARLQGVIRETDIVARFGGDEFAIIGLDIRDPADAAILAEKVLDVIGEPFSIKGNEIRTGASVGIAVYGADSPDAETLLSHADVALYRAKSEGRGTYRFFTDVMDTEVRTRVTMGMELREAILSGQLFLVYQPQVEADTGRIIGVEGLVRWRHPKLGVISPAVFIPVAEKSGLIVSLGHWVIHEACRQMRAWLDAGIALPLISVNLSSLQFKTPRELENDISDALTRNALTSQCLELELTESVLMDASREHSDTLLRLRKAGVRLAIDDFGTGYSSLDYLRRFPVNRLKIAQDFILDLTPNSGNAAIVKAAISLARELGLDVMVEGVETIEQLELVRSWGCREVQGYYFSKPLPASDATALLRVGTIDVPGVAAGGRRTKEESASGKSAPGRKAEEATGG